MEAVGQVCLCLEQSSQREEPWPQGRADAEVGGKQTQRMGGGHQSLVERTCFTEQEQVDEILGGTGDRWKAHVGRVQRGEWAGRENRCGR